MNGWFLALLLCTVVSGHADQVRETFASRGRLQSATAIWNQALGAVHPTLAVMNFKAGFVPKALDVGDGSNGRFEPSTYASFSQGGDLSSNIIRLNVSELNVTYFELAENWRIVPVANQPLIIRSLSDVIIRGEIHCQGENGGAASGTVPGAGGQGRCGGYAGGAGGAVSAAGVNGANTAGTPTGGRGGNFPGAGAVAGGGGGSWNLTSTPGNGSGASVSGGQSGMSVSDPEFLNLLGGAGGGGGSGSTTEAGGGGGGGGGVVIIHAVRNFTLGNPLNTTVGFIFARGGSGGASGNGAPGGGGGGGSVQVFVGGAIEIHNVNGAGAARAEAGAGGTNTGSTLLGGIGGGGRSWFSSVTYNSVGAGFYTPAEEPPVGPGNVEFSSAAQSVTLKTVDTLSSAPTYLSASTVPVSADFSLEYNGSDDGAGGGATGWTANLSDIQGKRFVQVRATVTTSNVNSPTLLDEVILNYTPSTIDQFRFKAAGCGLTTTPTPQPPTALLLLSVFLLLGLLSLKLKARKADRAKSQVTTTFQ